MQNLADAIALQALYQAYLKWARRGYCAPHSVRWFAGFYSRRPIPDALPALWR